MTEPALLDLDDLFVYVAARNPAVADNLVKSLLESLRHIAGLGVTGVARDWISPGLRLHVHGKYCAYFGHDDSVITVLRIVHGARDIASLKLE